ncbi:MAG TPA: hypothetical protein VGE52_10895 [Pirellulales bacterium]
MSPDELRYVVNMEVHPVLEPIAGVEIDPDVDHLEELSEMIDQIDVQNHPDLTDGTTHQLRLDLCPCCRKKFVKNPLARETISSNHSTFSEN